MTEQTTREWLTADPVDLPPPGDTPTRPTVASRRARRTREPRKVIRYTLDLEQEQHRFLRLYALQNDVEASKVMRTLLYLLEADDTLQQRVFTELFGADDTTDPAGD